MSDSQTTEIDYVSYVQDQLKAYQEATRFVQDFTQEISPAQINRALGQYSSVQIGLIAEYKRVEAEHQKLKTRFDLWWDELYVKKRRELNDPALPATKWLSRNEIDSEVRVANREEYLQKIEELNQLEVRVSFLKHLLDSWKRHGDIIVSLSHNMRSELKALGIDNRANASVRQERKVRSGYDRPDGL